jgi:hypothetical protein
MTIANPASLGENPLTTGIGSLPHHNIDAALEFSFRFDIPFLPQIPIRNPWEYMIPHALEGLPGLMVNRDGEALLRVDVWKSQSHLLDARLENELKSPSRSGAPSSFEPSAPTSSSWQPFIWEIAERKAGIAKIQIAGPMTAQWALQLSDGSKIDRHPELASQIFRLVTARALAMARRLREAGAQPLLFIDEPGLFGLDPQNPRHQMGLQELKLMLQILRKNRVFVGLHCCSDTAWSAVLQLPLDFLSIDTHLSLGSILKSAESRQQLETFLRSGGRLSLGVIPTGIQTESFGELSGQNLFQELEETLTQSMMKQSSLTAVETRTWIQQLLRQSLYTPACGLGMLGTETAERVQELLFEFKRKLPKA